MLRIGPAIIPSTIGMVTASRGNARRQRSRIARRVAKALDALGGLESPAGSCVRHVVGLQRLIREWAMRQGWVGGRCGWNKRRGSWWRRWECWQGTMGMKLMLPQDGRKRSSANVA
jgi:hypothetical protein